MTYSSDFRRQVLSVRDRECLTLAEVAFRFDSECCSLVEAL